VNTNFMILGAMDQKLWMFEVFRRSSGNQKTFYFLTFLGWIFFHRFLTKFLIIHQLEKVLRYMEFSREMLKDQLHFCKKL
jgi:hypothetical protein